jgi:hypothetical protein
MIPREKNNEVLSDNFPGTDMSSDTWLQKRYTFFKPIVDPGIEPGLPEQ